MTHRVHGAPQTGTGARRFIPSLSTGALVAAITAFMLGGLVVSIADELAQRTDSADSSVAVDLSSSFGSGGGWSVSPGPRGVTAQFCG